MVKQIDGIKRERSDDGSSDEEGVAPQHEEMYAGVSNLFAACEATNATRPKRHRTEEEKKQERLAANRRSARESRNRKKLVFEELQRSVARLAEENASLRKENETIRAQMSALKRQFGLPDDTASAAGVQGLAAQGGGMGGVNLSQGLNLMQQGDNQGGGGGNMDQAQQLAMLEAAQQAQAQQQLQLAAAGLNPFSGNLEGGGQGGGDGQGGDYQERLQLFQRRVEERSQLINQLKNSISGGGGGGSGGMGGQGSNTNLEEALRRQLQQQGQGDNKMPMGSTGFS